MRGKKILSVLLSSVLLLYFIACGKLNETRPTNGASSKEELSGTIVVWSWDAALKALQESSEKFKKKHPKIIFQFEQMSSNQVYDKLTTGISSNTGLPDVVSLEGVQIPKFGKQFPSGFVDVTSQIKKIEYLPVKISECTVEERIIAFPWDSAPAGLFYRKDLFEKAGIKVEEIKTWDDFIEAGKKMDKIGSKMIALSPSRKDTTFRLILNEFGSFYFDNEGKTALNSESAIKAMTIVKKINDANINYKDSSWDDFVSATKAGKVAAIAEAVWIMGPLQASCPELSGKWAVMRLPSPGQGAKTAGINGGSSLAVTASSKNEAAAIAFAKFATTDRESIINGFSKYGLYPSYLPVYSDPVFDKAVDYCGGQKIWRLFAEIGKDIPNLTHTENYAEANEAVINTQAKILLMGGDLKIEMNELQKEVVNKCGK